jgi:hypothetical protein
MVLGWNDVLCFHCIHSYLARTSLIAILILLVVIGDGAVTALLSDYDGREDNAVNVAV